MKPLKFKRLMRLRLILAGVAVPLLLWACLPLVSAGAPQGSAASIQNKINQKQAELDKKLGTEHVLSSTIAGYSKRINALESRIKVLRTRQSKIQSDLDAKRDELQKIQGELRTERKRLSELRAKLADGRETLEKRLVELYQTQPPDLVTVVLDSKGFADLLERGEFLRHIQDQDKQLIDLYAGAKADSEATAAKLDTLEQRQQKITTRVLVQRDAVSSVRMELVKSQAPLKVVRAAKNKVLGSVRNQRENIQEDLDKLQAANAQATGNLAGLPPQAIKGGNGPWDWPVSGPITGAFGEQRPGHIHAGIDIAVPVGTPIRAVANGKVVLLQGTAASGGYGNYTCLQHTATLTSCYAHQASFAVRMGQTVAQHQVIGYVGMTGHTFGPHLHFEARINGVPVQPLNYL
jgi:murein DD-endopeptidase MepM/ murein hydrolase activator NlpD